jgi:hypothetical protein
LSGSARRIGELQHMFDIPPLYGSQLDWQGYSIHDAANILRRFLNSLPDPVITHKSYNDFRNFLGKYREDDEEGLKGMGLDGGDAKGFGWFYLTGYMSASYQK